jgi:SpoVK/Ycf46/Vps4 family AAA+-type ATPase
MLKKLLHNKVTVDLNNLVSLTAGFVAADLKMLLSLVSIEHYQRIKHLKSEVDIPINEEDFIKALALYTPLAKKEGFTSIPDITLDDVGALASIK